MIGRVIEIAPDGRHLAVSRGFMTISAEGNEAGRVPLDDIGVLLCHAHRALAATASSLADRKSCASRNND